MDTHKKSGDRADQIVDDAQLARQLGIPVSALRAMVSGDAEIPDQLKGVIPEPNRVTRLEWRAEDVAGVADRFHAISEEQDRREQGRAADADYIAQRQLRIDRDRQAAEFAQQRAASEEAREDRIEFEDEFRPQSVSKESSFWGGLRTAWSAFQSSKDIPQPSSGPLTAASDGLPMAEPVHAPGRRASKARSEHAREDIDVSTASVPVPEKPEKNLAREAAKAAKAEKAAAKNAAKAERQQADSSAADEKQARRAELKAAKDALAQEKRDAAAAKKAEKQQKLTPEGRDAQKAERASLATQKKLTAERKKVEAAEQKVASKERANLAREEAKDQKKRSAESRKALMARYNAALKKWKEDVKIAKANGVKPPRKPKRPKTNTSKPDMLVIVNAVRAFATMLDNSPGELESLDVMVHEYEGTRIGDAFRRIHFRMNEQNATLVEAFAPESLFPAEVHNMLQVGSRTVDPGDALRTAVSLMDSSNDAKRNLRSEIAEPVGVGAASIAVLFGVAWFAMPQYVTMYESLEMPIPPVSSAILVLSDVIVWTLGIVVGALLLYAAWWFAYGRRWDRWRTAIDAYKLHMPILGKANQAQETYHILKVLNAYMSVGSPEREALVDAAEATENRAIKKHLLTTAELMIQGRTTFAGVFETDYFPNMVRNIVATGEKTGRTLETIQSLEKTYEREADVETKQGVSRLASVITGAASLIFVVVSIMASVPPLEMFGSTLSYGQ